MSATLEPGWLDTFDFRGKFPGEPHELDRKDYDPTLPLFKRMTAVKMLAPLGISATKDGKEVAATVLKTHINGTQTLVVLNTVDRAKAVYAAIKKDKTAPKELLLVHSRFRPRERELLNARLQEAGRDRIIVATQVVEAGVDISARTLVTELAPWASVVQRIGRCNRTGDDGPGQVFWIELDIDKQAAPYEADDLHFTRQQVQKLNGKGVSPKALDDFKREQNITLPFEHKHVVRRRDILDLFDTSADLSGNDIDVSRFVRGDDPETDVQVFWRAGPPDNEWDMNECRRQAARRLELCNVPINSFKTEFLGAGKMAYRYDYLDGEWRGVGKRDLGSVVPGQVFWAVADQGGYDADVGWSPGGGRLPDHLLVPLPATPPKRRGQRPEGFYDSDEWSRAGWRTIAEHTGDVVREVTGILRANSGLQVTGALQQVLTVAARWHDWGKAHEIFQSGVAEKIDDPRDETLPADRRRAIFRPEALRGCALIAKAQDEFWQRYTRAIHPADPNSGRLEKRVRVRRFRHELASVLGVLALERQGTPPADWQSLGSAERLLARYLIASHHGKVRLSIRTMPDESPIPPDPDRRKFAAGVWDGDSLPSADLGGIVSPPAAVLTLDAMQLGGADSWSAGVLELRDATEFGPFRLAYLESLLRAADCRASDLGEGDTDD